MTKPLAQMKPAGLSRTGHGRFTADTSVLTLSAAARAAQTGAVVVFSDRADEWLALEHGPLVMEFDPGLASAARVTVETLAGMGREFFVIIDVDYRASRPVAETVLAVLQLVGRPGGAIIRDHRSEQTEGSGPGLDHLVRAVDERVAHAPEVTVTASGDLMCDLAQFEGVA